MSDIPSLKAYIQQESVGKYLPISEFLRQRMGGSINFLLDFIFGSKDLKIEDFTATKLHSFVAQSDKLILIGAGGGGGGGGAMYYSSGTIAPFAQPGQNGLGAPLGVQWINVVRGRTYAISLGDGGAGGLAFSGTVSGDVVVGAPPLPYGDGTQGESTTFTDTVTSTQIVEFRGGDGGQSAIRWAKVVGSNSFSSQVVPKLHSTGYNAESQSYEMGLTGDFYFNGKSNYNVNYAASVLTGLPGGGGPFGQGGSAPQISPSYVPPQPPSPNTGGGGGSQAGGSGVGAQGGSGRLIAIWV